MVATEDLSTFRDFPVVKDFPVIYDDDTEGKEETDVSSPATRWSDGEGKLGQEANILQDAGVQVVRHLVEFQSNVHRLLAFSGMETFSLGIFLHA